MKAELGLPDLRGVTHFTKRRVRQRLLRHTQSCASCTACVRRADLGTTGTWLTAQQKSARWTWRDTARHQELLREHTTFQEKQQVLLPNHVPAHVTILRVGRVRILHNRAQWPRCSSGD